jgi:uncharacterized iron-regulated protein
MLFAAFSIAGCFRRAPLPEWVSKLPDSKEALGPEEIFHLPDGERISFGRLLERLERPQVVFVGESHDQIEHHQIEQRILRELSESGKKLAVGMEMFKQSQQPVLDRWSQGLLTEQAFLKEVDWENTWGMDYSLYKGILDEVQKRHIKLLGLNLDKDLTRKVGKEGIRGLSAQDRERLPSMDLSDRTHRDYIRAVFKGHHGGVSKKFEYFYEAQCLWDEGMAEAVAAFISSPEGQGSRVLVVAGSSHIAFGFGIPKRLSRRVPIEIVTVILKQWRTEMDGDLNFSGMASSLADFIWITRPNPPEVKRPRIGVLLQKKDGSGGLWIERVLPESPAEKAGLASGDRIVAVEGTETEEVAEIHRILTEKGWGSEVRFIILRDGTRKEIKVILPAAPE